MELQTLMKIMERLEEKVDEIRDSIHTIDLMANGTAIKQAAQEKEIRDLKLQVVALKTAHDRASGAWKLLSLPGVIGFIHAAIQVLRT